MQMLISLSPEPDKSLKRKLNAIARVTPVHSNQTSLQDLAKGLLRVLFFF